MVSLDPPAHGRLRKPAARAFTPRRVREMEPRIRATAAELLDAVDATRAFDLIEALAFPLPMRIMFSFMGVPEADWPRLKEWCGQPREPRLGPADARGGAAPRAADGPLPPLPARARGGQGRRPRRRLRQRAAGDPRRGPRRAQRTRRSPRSCSRCRFAGHETTNNLIGNCVRRLLEVPERWARLVAEPALIAGAVDEILRFDPSVPVWRRVTTRPVTLGGVDLPGGREAVPVAGRRGPRRRRLPRARRVRSRARQRPPHARVRPRHPLLHRLRARAPRSDARARGADPPLSRATPGRPSQEIPFHPNISFRGPQALWVRSGPLLSA